MIMTERSLFMNWNRDIILKLSFNLYICQIFSHATDIREELLRLIID